MLWAIGAYVLNTALFRFINPRYAMPFIPALALGIAKGAYEASIKYSKERQQFGQPIAHFQAISFKLADMATNQTAKFKMLL